MGRGRELLVPLSGAGFILVGIVSFIGVVATVLLVFFGAYLRGFLRAAAGDAETLSLVAFVGLAIVGVGFAIDSTILIALSEAADDISPSAVQALQALWDNDFVPIVLGTELFLWGTGISAIRSGALPGWLGWVMVLPGVIGFTPIGFVSAIGSAILVLVLSVMLAVRARGAEVAA